MERVSITERPDWREKAHEYGFNFHTMYGEPYWCEDAYYKLTLAQVEKLEEVTAELHQMCLKVVEKVIASDELMTKFRIPKHTWSFVRQSWLTHQPSLYSRLDLAWDGTGEPKLLENNADTPTSLYEAAFFQWIDLLALNNALSKPVSTNPENVAPQTPEQNAIADGYAPDSPAPVVQQTSARTTTSNGHNPFRN